VLGVLVAVVLQQVVLAALHLHFQALLTQLQYKMCPKT
jgi:hypothetical protein